MSVRAYTTRIGQTVRLVETQVVARVALHQANLYTQRQNGNERARSRIREGVLSPLVFRTHARAQHTE